MARAAEVYPRCYYAWNYRIWLVEQQLALAASHVAALACLGAELVDNAGWLRRHIGDGSAYNHRRFLLRRLLAVVDALDVPTRSAASVLQVEFRFNKHILL